MFVADLRSEEFDGGLRIGYYLMGQTMDHIEKSHALSDAT